MCLNWFLFGLLTTSVWLSYRRIYIVQSTWIVNKISIFRRYICMNEALTK
jgi:hypothetical protein